jgi:hypothetical protein
MKAMKYALTVLGLLTVSAWALPLHEGTFPVDVQGDAYTLYTDPHTGNEVKVGGFSGLYPVPGNPCQFYVVTDIGPSPDYFVTDSSVDPAEVVLEYKIMVRPDLGPRIMKLQLLPDGTAEILSITPLVNEGGGLITGRPNTDPTKVYDLNLDQVPSDPDALDCEGITIDPAGNFWVCEEGRPSVAWVDSAGTVLGRLVPKGTLTGTEQVPTFDILPGILRKRVNNRGMEGVAFASNSILYSILQRPLANPNKAASEASRNIRIVAIDLKALAKGKPAVRQYLYLTELVHPGDYASDLFSVTPSIFLVPERKADKLIAINISPATDITPYENEDGTLKSDPSLTIERLDEAGLAALGIRPVQKTVVLDSMTAIDASLSKCEGLCLVGKYLVLTADNDFNLAETVVDLADHPITPVPITLQDPPNLPRIHVVPLPNGWAFGR